MVIRSRKSKKFGQYHGKNKKKANNGQQNTTLNNINLII